MGSLLGVFFVVVELPLQLLHMANSANEKVIPNLVVSVRADCEMCYPSKIFRGTVCVSSSMYSSSAKYSSVKYRTLACQSSIYHSCVVL